MDDRLLLLSVRTPREEVLRCRVRALRVPTETGSVGILPRAEQAVLVVEPGLVVAHADDAVVFAGTAGGLLRIGRAEAVLLSPLAVTGDDAVTILERMDALTRAMSTETELRRRIETLERGLIAASRRHNGASWRPHEERDERR